MHIGMLWFVNTPNLALSNRLERAAEFYRRKYHHEPNLCLVHPSMLEGAPAESGRVTIRGYRAVLPGHLWIGVEDNA